MDAIVSADDNAILIERPRCRIPQGEPEEPGFAWEELPLLPPFGSTYFSRLNTPVPTTDVRAVASAHALHVRFDCRTEDIALLTPPPSDESAHVERTWIELMPRNDPCERFRFDLDLKGSPIVQRIRRMPGELYNEGVSDLWEDTTDMNRGEWSLRNEFQPEGWWSELFVPWNSIGLNSRPSTIGLRYTRVFATGENYPALDSVTWPAPEMITAAANLPESGEACIGPRTGVPVRLKLNPPRFGTNTGRLTLGDDWPDRPTKACVRTQTADGETLHSADLVIAPQDDEIVFEYRLDREHCSHVNVFEACRVCVELSNVSDMSDLSDLSDRTLYSLQIPMDRHLGICVDEPFGEPPSPEAEPLRTRDAILDRITRALPRLHRATTLQGAPSDFCLMYEDETPAVNLMADDAWESLVEIIESRFSSTEDRLVGAMALVGQKSVTNLIGCTMFFDAAGVHTYHSAAHELMGPLSILRYGGGPAVSRAAVLARLLRQLSDPSTGRPFTTRILSLTKDGGPRQVTRRYAEQGNLAPFVQEPGLIGVVAVDIDGSRTLLDPTALAFFASADGGLATIEEMLADDALRRDGAGRLADVYAKIDPEEVDRQPADQLLSRGVFPELCPDEDGANTPFSLRAVQAPRIVNAVRPVLSDVEGGDIAPATTGFVDQFGMPGRREGSVSVRRTEDALEVRVGVAGVSPQSLNDRDRELERMHLLIDAEHGNLRFHHFFASLSGERGAWRERAENIQTLFKHLSSENWNEEAEVDVEAWGCSATGGSPLRSDSVRCSGSDGIAPSESSRDGYEMVFSISLGALGVESLPPVVGMNVWIEGRRPCYEQVFLSRPRFRIPADPFSFADVYTTNTPIEVRRIDWGVRGWGMNHARAALANAGDDDAEVTLQVMSQLGMREHVTELDPVPGCIPAHDEEEFEFTHFINPKEKMGQGPDSNQVSTLVIRDKQGAECYRSSIPLNYSTAPGVYQRYGTALGAPPNPAPGQDGHLEKKITYICSRIPEFDRLTTRDGAEGDFVIRARDGSIEFNFMQPGVLDAMARYIEQLFDNDLDRLLGIYFLSYHPAVARHLSTGHRFNDGCGPLSLIRLYHAGGGGNCGFHSRVFAGMAAHLKLKQKRIVAHTVPISGHVISAVEWDGSKALLDADVGHLIFSADGEGLASIELLRDREPVLTTAGEGDLARYFTFSYDAVRRMASIDDEDFAGVFPSGGPRA